MAWLATDKNGGVYLYLTKPFLTSTSYYDTIDKYNIYLTEQFIKVLNITPPTFEEGPVEVELSIKDNLKNVYNVNEVGELYPQKPHRITNVLITTK